MGVARREVLDLVRSLAARFPDYGIEGEVYVTAPGSEIDEGHELVAAIDASHEEVFGETPERDVTRWFSDALRADALRHPDRQLRHVDRADGRRARREPRDRRAREDGADLRARRAEGLRVKLVTYDDGKVGRVDGEEIVRLDVPTMREYFERGGADDTDERTPLAEAKLAGADRPEEVLPHRRQLPRARGGVEERRLVARRSRRGSTSSRTSTRSSAPTSRSIYPEHLTEELDYELELAVVLKKSGKWFSPEEAADYIGGYVIFNDITARDIQRGEMRSGVFSFCKAIDTFCPLGPWIVTPDEIPDPHDLTMELRVNGEVRQESHSGRMSVTIPEILSNFSGLGYSAGDVLSTGTVAGVAGFKSPEERALLYLKPGDVIEAEIERIGVLRTPVISWQEGTARRRRRGSAPGARTPRWLGRATTRSSSAYAR